jgi:hypothetical protein
MRMRAGLLYYKRVSCFDNGVEGAVWIRVDWHEGEGKTIDAVDVMDPWNDGLS